MNEGKIDYDYFEEEVERICEEGNELFRRFEDLILNRDFYLLRDSDSFYYYLDVFLCYIYFKLPGPVGVEEQDSYKQFLERMNIAFFNFDRFRSEMREFYGHEINTFNDITPPTWGRKMLPRGKKVGEM